jgi:hypothetical protein
MIGGEIPMNSDRKPDPAAARAERLRASLRENLKRRKAQNRARTKTASKGAQAGEAAEPGAPVRQAPPRRGRDES